MTQTVRALLALALVASLAGCGGGFRPLGFLNRDRGGSDVPPPAVAVDDEAEEVEGVNDPEETTADAPVTGVLGTTVATLGDPTRPGMWLETPLVSAERPGVLAAENGNSAEVILMPSGGAAGSGSRISIMAMQALGVGLTDLPMLTVSVGG